MRICTRKRGKYEDVDENEEGGEMMTHMKLQGLHFDFSQCQQYLKQGSGTPRCPSPVFK